MAYLRRKVDSVVSIEVSEDHQGSWAAIWTFLVRTPSEDRKLDTESDASRTARMSSGTATPLHVPTHGGAYPDDKT